MSKYDYLPTEWLDQIVETDAFGHVVYEKDEQGNIVYWEDNYGNIVVDPITKQPIPKPRLLQEGTRHSAARENNQENGILKSHERLNEHDKLILRLKIQAEIEGRAPENTGYFLDDFDGTPNKLVAQTASATLTAPRSAGTTVLNVDGTEGFEAFTEVTIYDGTNSEDVLITDFTASTITVQPLVNDYVKGAVIARSNAVVQDGQLVGGSWGTYNLEVSEVV